MAAVCITLGWMVTTSLGPIGDEMGGIENASYDIASGGVLTDPSGFGAHNKQEDRPGIIGDGEDPDPYEKSGHTSKEPSVSGALSDLHHAVSDKLHSWNPYHVKSSNKGGSTSSNKTSSAKLSQNNTLAALGGEYVNDGIKEEDRLGARTRIGKVTILFYGNGFWERCIRTHEIHDKVHGYRLHVLRQQQLMDDVWSKPAYILSLLLRELSKPESERLEWLMWVDADTVILNPYIPIETFLPPSGTEFDDVYLMYSNDWNGLNNGVFPIRVNQWAVNLFASIVSYRHWKPEEPLTFRDQSAMNNLMQEPEFAKHIVQAPQRWFNAYQGEHNETLQPYQIRRGDLLVHFAGVPGREERMRYWLERAEQHLDDWEVPVKSTSYPQEARDFWREQGNLRKDKQAKVLETTERASKLMTTTDQKLNDYGDRLTDEQKELITKQRDALKGMLENEKTKADLIKLEDGISSLSEAAKPLTGALTHANKLLLQSAHEAIFTGEKDLLESGFSQGTTSPELEQVSGTVKNLKVLVMAPEESWNRNDITSAINALTEARAKLQETVIAEQAAEEAQEAQVLALEEEMSATQQEADSTTGDAGLMYDHSASMLFAATTTTTAVVPGELIITTAVVQPTAFSIQQVVVTVPGPVVTISEGYAVPAPSVNGN